MKSTVSDTGAYEKARRPKSILLVEDDDIDVMTVRRAFSDLAVKNPLSVANDGEHALELLKHMRELPCLILLDVNMPRMNGLELLAELKAHGRYRRIPVVMLTTSSDERDRRASFDLSAAGYMTKPVEYPAFLDVVRTIDSYWTLSELGQ